MSLFLQVLAWASLLAGGAFLLVGAIGAVRFPDFFSRMHAAGVTDTLGAGLMILGMILQSDMVLNTVKLVTILIFIWFTSPVASHALGHAAIVKGLKPWRKGDKAAASDVESEPS